MNRISRKVFIVEADRLLQNVFSFFVEELGHNLLGVFATADEAFKECERIKPDVVLLDINLPHGTNSIVAANKFYLEYNVPIIYLSSYIEDISVLNAINFSSYGYLTKPIDKVSLGITIDQVCWRHEFDQQKKISEQLIEHIQHAVFTISLNGKILYANEAFNFIFNVENPIGKYLYHILQIDKDNFHNEVVEEVLKNRFLNAVVKHNHDNKTKYIQLNYNTLLDEINEVYAIAVFAQDITPLIELTEGFNKLGAIQAACINGIKQMVMLFDKENKLILFNELTQKFYEKKLHKSLDENDDIEKVLFYIQKNELNSLISNVYDGIFHSIERTIKVPEDTFFVQINWIPVKLENNVINILLLISDITYLRNLESNYEEQKNELKPIFESTIQRFYLVDLNLKILAFNKSANEIIYKEFGRSLKKGDYALDLVPQPERKEIFLKHFELAKQGYSVFFKESYPLKNELRWNETHLDPVVNETGEINRILIWTLDITEREQYLHDLKESQERYELIARGGNDGIFDWDIVKNTVYLSPRWKALLGYEDYELKNAFGTRDSLIHPDDIENATKTLDKYLTGKTPIYENQFRLRHKKGHYIWVIERGELLKDDEGNNIRLAGSITDITRLKNTEENLLKLNKTLLDERKMFMQGSVVIFRRKADDCRKFIYVSENVEEILGYDKEDFILERVSYDELIHVKDIEIYKKEINNAMNENLSLISFSPYRIKKKNGSYIWVKDFSTIIYNEEDKTNDILGYFIDITQQKNSELKIIETNKRYVSLFEEASDAIILIDEKIVEANQSAEQMFGYNKEELKQMDFLSLSPEFQKDNVKSEDRFKNIILKSMTGDSEVFYWQFKTKDNKIIDTEVGLSLIVINNKKIIYQAIIRNITERMKIEQMLIENEHRIKMLLEAIPDLIFIIDKNNFYTYFKPDRDKKFDVPHEKVIGKHVSDFFSGESYQKFVSSINQCRETKQIVELKYKLNAPPLGLRNYEARFSPLDNDEVLLVVRDLGEVVE